MKPLGVIFDLGDTILRVVSSDWRSGNERLLELADNRQGFTASMLEPISTELAAEVFAYREQFLLELRYEDFIRLLCETTGISLRVSYEVAVREVYKAALSFEPVAGVRDTLQKLASLGIRMGVLSNSSFSGELLRDELDRHNLTQFFTYVLSSADYGLRKPNPRLVSLAVKKLGLNPNETWFVGDRIEADIAGALRAGLHPVWYNPRGESLPAGYRCDQVGSWDEFLNVIERLPQR